MTTALRGGARALTVDDLPAAARLLGDSLDEMPVYRWILGDDRDDPAARTWLAQAILAPLLDGRVFGVDDADRPGRLVGVLACTEAHGVSDGTVSGVGGGTEATVDEAFVRAHEGMLRRFVHVGSSSITPPPEPDAIGVPVAAVHPDARRSRALYRLVEPVHSYCTAHERRFYVWTGVPELRDAFCRRWHLTPYASVDYVDGSTLFGLQSKRPPAPVPFQ